MQYIALALYTLLCTSFTLATEPEYLRLTAITSDAADGKAKFQCWEFPTPFSKYPTVGKAISGLAAVSNISYVVLPPNADEGLHHPPFPMFFILLSGLAHVTLPEGDEDLWIREGVNSLIVAADMYGAGHYTKYPSDKPSVALQIPFEGGVVPEHLVIGRDVRSVGAENFWEGVGDGNEFVLGELSV